jgi:Ca-activated chloride channel family protein
MQAGGMRSWLMYSGKKKKYFEPALVFTALALFFGAALFLGDSVTVQKIKQLPPPPPAPRYKPKPTPTPEPPEYEVIRVSSNLVVMPVSVTDANGQPILGLKATDFRIEEDGRPQEISQLGDPEQVPLDVALLIDVSGTVNARFDFEKEAAARFLSQVLKPNDHAAIFTIDRIPVLIQPSANVDVIRRQLRALTPAADKGPTAYYDTVIAAARYLAKTTPEQHRRVVIVISDGEDNYSDAVRDSAKAAYRATKDEGNELTPAVRARIKAASEAALQNGHRKAQADVLREIQTANIVFYAINPSGEALRLNVISTRAQNAMQQLASATGGTAFVPERIENLEAVFGRIASELRAQYLLQYYSNDKSGGTAFRRIGVTTPARPQLRVRAREGYYPKAK